MGIKNITQKNHLSSHFLGIEINKFGFKLKNVLDEIETVITRKKSWTVITINLHAISLMQSDKNFYNVYRNVDKILFDGISAIWLGKISGFKNIERIGHDFLMKALYETSIQKDWSFYFLGAKRGKAEKCALKIKHNFKNIKIAGTHHGYFNKKEENRIIREINEISPDILAVGLGMPYQEKWIHNNKSRLKVGMITNCGAYIEQTANKGIDYYPDWAYRYNLNWFYRILKEPKKLWKRYLLESIQFLVWLPKYIIKDRFKDRFF